MGTLGTLLTFGAALLALYVLCMLLVVPLKWILRLIANGIVGFLLLAVVNMVGSSLFGFSVPLNLVNVLVAGICGVPGIAGIIALRLFL